MRELTGRVKFFNHERGFGILTPDDGSGECFVQRSDIRAPDGAGQTLCASQRVRFYVRLDADRPRAVDVIPGGYSAAPAQHRRQLPAA